MIIKDYYGFGRDGIIEDNIIRPVGLDEHHLNTDDKRYIKRNCKISHTLLGERLDRARHLFFPRKRGLRYNTPYLYNGKQYNLDSLSKLSGISKQSLSVRIHCYKWSIEKAVTTKIKKYGTTKS